MQSMTEKTSMVGKKRLKMFASAVQTCCMQLRTAKPQQTNGRLGTSKNLPLFARFNSD